MAFDDGLDNGQTESAAARCACYIRLVKALEYGGQVLGCDARPAVPNSNPDTLVCWFRRQGDLASVGSVPEGVRRKVLQRLFETIGISDDASGRIDSQREIDITLRQFAIMPCRHAPEQFANNDELTP